MCDTMSAVTTQPLPFERLEREKHIQMIFRAFQDGCGPSRGFHSQRAKPHQTPPDFEPQEALSGLPSPERNVENSFGLQAGGKPSERGMEEEEEVGGDEGRQFISMLETVNQIHITARPDLQGPQCVSRRIYTIATSGSVSQMFVAVEESSCVCLQCCGPARACSLQGFDHQGHQIFYFERPLRADACCLGCCLMEMRAFSPQKRLVGIVRQRWSMFTPLLEVCDAEGASRVRIQGPCCPCRCFSNQRFHIVSSIGEKTGTIWKKWPGFNGQCNMDHEYFGLEVSASMDSRTKLLLLAATFLLNHMFFEMS